MNSECASMKEIIHVIPHHGMGGMQNVVRALAESMPAWGFSSRTVDLANKDTPFPAGVRKAHALWSQMSKTHYDAILSHAPKSALLASLVAVVARVPQRVVVFHESASTLNANTLRLLDFQVYLRIITDVVFVGETVKNSFGSYPHLVARGTVIRNGLLSEQPRRTWRKRQQPARPVLLYAGRLVQSKNVNLLIRVASEIRWADLVICGDGPERPRLERLANDLNLNVAFEGKIPAEELTDWYRTCAVFCFPSRSEGLPLVLLEAAAEGAPIVASDIAQNREVMGNAAAFCAVDDPDHWRASIRTLLTNPLAAERLSSDAYLRLGAFTTKQMAAGYAELLGSRT